MKTGTAIFLVGMAFALGYCGQNRTMIDCRDWSPQDCIEFVREVKALRRP